MPAFAHFYHYTPQQYYDLDDEDRVALRDHMQRWIAAQKG